MKLSSFISFALAAAIGTNAGAVLAATTLKGSEIAQQASIPLAHARAVALRAAQGGTVVAEELEREKGGSGLRYTFDIKTAKGVREVGVDAKTGEVLESQIESAKVERAEG
jgi:uncharacterized membrane protein YkoI